MSVGRNHLINKKRIVVKIGSSSLFKEEGVNLNFERMEKLVSNLLDLKSAGKDVCLVSSGAIAIGRAVLEMKERPSTLPLKQACACIGQANMIMMYEGLFRKHGINIGQVLLTRNCVLDEGMRRNASNAFEEMFRLGVVPIVNENDSISTDEIDQVGKLGDNDRLSAYVAQLIGADLLILLSDIEGMYTDDPRVAKDAKLIPEINELSEELKAMAKGTAEKGVGTGGMSTKIAAAEIFAKGDAQMLIINGNDPDNIRRAIEGEDIGTLFSLS